MKYTYLDGNPVKDTLLLFFGGWSFSPQMLSCYEDGTDVLFLYDYRNMDVPAEVRSIVGKYENVHVFAWSFGVLCADITVPELCPDKVSGAVAVNGTSFPVSDTCGIPEKIFRGTLDGLDDASLRKFGLRMCGGASLYRKHVAGITYCIEELREELAILGSLAPVRSGIWKTAVISSSDRIFPPENMKSFWSGEKNIKIMEVDSPHFPFGLWNRFEDLKNIL